MIDLHLPGFSDNLKLLRKEDGVYVFDPIRRKYLVKTPEEVVRQLVVQYLILAKGYSSNRISIEKSLRVNTRLKRFDILVYNEAMLPWLMVECKSPKVALSQDTFRQIAQYNLPLRVKYLLVTNGVQTFCCEMNYEEESYHFLTEVPAWHDAHN